MSTIKNVSYYLAGMVLSKPLGFILSIVVAKSLGPFDFGSWVTLMLVISYSPIACFGAVETLLKKVPFFLGRNEHANVTEIENAVMGSVVLSAALVLVLALFSPFIVPLLFPGIDPLLVMLMLVTAATSYFSAYFNNRVTAYQDFKVVGAIGFIRSALALLFVGSLSWLWGLRGAVIGYLLHEFFVGLITMIISIRSHGRVGVSYNRDSIISAVKIGFPITLLSWILTLNGTVDRVVLGKMLGPLSVGYYGLGISIVSTLALIPLVVGRVLYPKVNKQFGQTQEHDAIKRLVIEPTFALGVLLANIQLVLLIVMPYLYNSLLPKFQPGLLAGEVLLLGSFYGCLMRNGSNYLIAANQERVFLRYILVTLLFNIGCDVCLVKAGLGVCGVALGTSLAGLLINVLVWNRVLVSLKFDFAQARRKQFELYLPNLFLVAIVVVINFIYPAIFQKFSIGGVLVGVLLFAVLNGLLYNVSAYRSGFLEWNDAFRRRFVPSFKGKPAS